MLSFSGSLKVFVAVEPCDMRKGYEGLAALVTTALQQNLRSGALFAFSNRRRTRLKVLYFDGSVAGQPPPRWGRLTRNAPVIAPRRKKNTCRTICPLSKRSSIPRR